MARNRLLSFAHDHSLALLLLFLLASTGALVYFQYLHYQAIVGKQARPIPLQGDASAPGKTTLGVGNTGKTGGPMDGQDAPVSIRLSQGQPQPRAAEPLPVATGSPLSTEDVARLLARLPQLTPLPGDEQEFRLAQQPIPPPRTGQTVQQPFPPSPEPLKPPAVPAGALEVLRFSPEGEAPIAPSISVTFNQPMVALTSVDALSAGQSPLQIDPPLPGTWRWLGTRTLTFQYDSTQIDRLPKATTYRLTIPAGTKSATGGVLAKTVEWSFTTPPPRVTAAYPPNEPQVREPLFFVQFDQRIDPAAVLKTVQVTAAGRAASLVLVSEAGLKEKPAWNELLVHATEGRWLAFRAAEPLPADSEVTVAIGPGTPSAEGPLTTQEAHSYTFRTYAPLRITEHGCAWSGGQAGRCQPFEPLFITFNNPIDAKSYREDMVRIDPELPGASINILGNTLQIQGETQGNTSYTVFIDGSLQDIFGQPLGQPASRVFSIGPAHPMLSGPDETFVTLDPSAQKPVFSVYALNYPRLEVQIYAVQPADWPAFQAYLREYRRPGANAQLPGRKVYDQSLPVETAADTLSEVNIDLNPYLDGKFGQLIVVVRPPKSLLPKDQDPYWQTINTWVQVTQIGLDAFNDHAELVTWTTALKDGAPLAGVTISAQPGGFQVATGADGVARFPIPDDTRYLLAEQGADKALLPRSSFYWGEETWSRRPVSDTLRWFVYDDRQMYRPGEEVHVKGWLRRVGQKQGGDVSLLSGEVSAIRYQVMDAQGNELDTGQVEPNALGGFDLAFTLPTTLNLGYTRLELSASGSLEGLEGAQYGHSFQVQEFRRPEFEVTARNETTGPYFAGEHAVLAVDAKYYAGGALPGAEVNWQVTSSTGQYSPPNWPDFTFGAWAPWWFGYMESHKPWGPGGGEQKVETFSGQTDAAGAHYLRLDFDGGGEPKPVSVIAQATVMDVNRQAWTGTTTLLVHPATLYVGLRSDRMFVERGDPLKVDFIVTDLDGNPQADRPVEVKAARLDWKYVDGNWKEVEADVQNCTTPSAQAPVTCTFNTPTGGSYRITATVADDLGRRNQSQFTRWVSGAQQPPSRKVEQEKLTLIPDKETYQPGETAQILVQSPFTPAEGLLTLNRGGILTTQRFRVENGSVTLSVPIEEAYIPNLNLQVDLTGAAPRVDDKGEPIAGVPPRPAFASGQADLSIPPVQRTLALELAPASAELEPGGETSLSVRVKDAAGQPVAGAELAVVVVDEAILALSNYQLPNPLDAFYARRSMDLSAVYSRASLVLANPLALAQNTAAQRQRLTKDMAGGAMESAAGAAPAAAQPTLAAAEPMMDGQAQPENANPIRVRTDFNPLAVFAPAVHTGADGAAQVTIKLPDNLTRYRVMVVAVDAGGRQFGQAETNLLARLPLMARPSAPRFLNFGDRFELPVVLQNQTGEPMLVDVAVQATNLELTGPAGMRVSVPAHDRVEVRFPAAAQRAGAARLQVAATAGNAADAALVELPVYTPATTEAFATYGVIDRGAVVQPLQAPQGVFPQFGGLEVSTSSTALQALTDAVLYLVEYPYEFSEQYASRILAISALRDVLTAFNAAGLPSPQEMEAAAQRDIQSLQGLQNDDGGFPYWRRGQESIPFNTIHAAHALVTAQAKGFDVPAEPLQRALGYLRGIESHYPAWYNQEMRQALSAYALFVRAQAGDKDTAKAQKLLDELHLDQPSQDYLPLDAAGWLWPVLKDSPKAESIRKYVANHVVETAGAANFTNQYDEQNYLLLGSDRRTDAILLAALMQDNPQADLIPKLVNGLLAHRTRGRWESTQENVFVLLALDAYFNAYESQTPDFVARLWLGDNFAGSQEFKGRSTGRVETNVPMAYLLDPQAGGAQDLTLSKEGAGRLYYRLGLRYAPTDLALKPLDMGFVVQRAYEAVDNPDDVSLDAEGVWRIRAGARVRVRLTLVADNRRYHVALTDPLPAGLEIVNPDLAVSAGPPPAEDPTQPMARRFWWWGPWYQHQNLRDERAEAFTPLLWDGVYTYTYIARATTPGRFVVPPAKAEEMYSPEVFGRSGSSVMIVK